MKTKSMIAAIMLASTFSLTACGGGAEEASSELEAGIAGLEISNARMVLAPVSGNPAAVYFDVKYSGDRRLTINSADVAGTKSSMIHDYGEYDFKVQMMEALPIPMTNEAEVNFIPGGLHVMAMDVSPDIQPGGKTEVTITVSGGDKHSFDAEILAAGDER